MLWPPLIGANILPAYDVPPTICAIRREFWGGWNWGAVWSWFSDNPFRVPVDQRGRYPVDDAHVQENVGKRRRPQKDLQDKSANGNCNGENGVDPGAMQPGIRQKMRPADRGQHDRHRIRL